MRILLHMTGKPLGKHMRTILKTLAALMLLTAG